MKVIVFGASGFIGGHLLRRLSQMGGCEIIGVDLVAPVQPAPSVDYRIGDVRDLSSFDVPGDIDLIVNLAAIHRTPGHPAEAYYETNVLGAIEVTRFAQRKNIKTILFTSSISVYATGETTNSEATPPAPASPYGWSKLFAERIHQTWRAATSDSKLIICRPAVVFGTNERGNFTRLTKLLKKGLFIYPGRKDTIKGCIYVEDLIDAMLFALEQPEPYILFNGCYPNRFTIEQIVETFRKSYFPNVRTFLLPRWVVMAVALVLKPFSTLGLGIHPDRVMKLLRSTDVVPGWLTSKGWSKPLALENAFKDWEHASQGRFD